MVINLKGWGRFLRWHLVGVANGGGGGGGGSYAYEKWRDTPNKGGKTTNTLLGPRCPHSYCFNHQRAHNLPVTAGPK